MIPFATEFPVVIPENKAVFPAAVVAWLRGTNYSRLLDSSTGHDLEREYAVLKSGTGEELHFRELAESTAVPNTGFRYDNPDDGGRLWRTEAVLRVGGAEDGQGILRVRTQCLARTSDAQLHSPKKPHLVRSLLESGWGGVDGSLRVSGEPIYLGDTDESLSIALRVVRGEASQWLPVVYLSTHSASHCALSDEEIQKLARDLGGVAHVVVEPNRSFSFRLRDDSDGANVYGGAIGLSLPRRGFIRRVALGWKCQTTIELANTIRAATIAQRSQMPARGWDWTELQEQALRARRDRDRNKLTAEEVETLYKEEIATLNDRINELQRELDAGRETEPDGGEVSLDELVRRFGPEIYVGEISDRIRYAVRVALSVADQKGIDARSRAVFGQILDGLSVSPGLGELKGDIDRVVKDPRRIATELTRLLCRHGFQEKSDNKHIRLQARDGFLGLQNVTIPKTPGEYQGLKNQKSQIESNLGLTHLDDMD